MMRRLALLAGSLTLLLAVLICVPIVIGHTQPASGAVAKLRAFDQFVGNQQSQPGCPFPCLRGVTIGKTTLHAVDQALQDDLSTPREAHYNYDHMQCGITLPLTASLVWSGNAMVDAGNKMTCADDGRVDGVNLQVKNPRELTLADLIAAFGPPFAMEQMPGNAGLCGSAYMQDINLYFKDGEHAIVCIRGIRVLPTLSVSKLEYSNPGLSPTWNLWPHFYPNLRWQGYTWLNRYYLECSAADDKRCG